ncbi:glucose 1-dehydrogenase [Sarocladium strictum]
MTSSFLAIENCHVFVTGASGGVGVAVVKEFLNSGCKVTAFDKDPLDVSKLSLLPAATQDRLHTIQGDLRIESALQQAFAKATAKFGPPQILIANAAITDENQHPRIWEIETETWDHVYSVNVRGVFLSIKYFVRGIEEAQSLTGQEMDNVSIIVTGSDTGVFGQAGHAEYASGKAGLQYGLVKTVKNKIVTVNRKARINAVAPGWINTDMIKGRLDDPREHWAEAEATTALRKIAEPDDVARCMAFLASHRTAGHITGQCINVDGGLEGRLLFREPDVHAQPTLELQSKPKQDSVSAVSSPTLRRRKMRISISVDFDAISGYMGTGHCAQNTIADYSAGLFGANVGVDRLLKVFRSNGISDKVTWFIPGHSMETFPRQTKSIIDSGAEIGLHGYSHEGASAMTEEQERDVMVKCISLATELAGGRKPLGYRAPLYDIRESTLMLLHEHGFLYDSSLNSYDAVPYHVPIPPVGYSPHIPDYTKSASSWMKPTPMPKPVEPKESASAPGLVEIPVSWYTEDATPLNFYPNSPSTHGYVGTAVVEDMWWDRFNWLWDHESWVEDEDGKEGSASSFGTVFPIILHPECAGRSHVIGMIQSFVDGVRKRMADAQAGEIVFETMASIAQGWRES